MGEPIWERNIGEDGTPNVYVTFPVTVTNTGKVAGKTPVQIYGQAPYIEGGVEKSAIQLLNFEKSSVLEPGASEVVNVKVDMQYIASYDMEYKNADGTQGTYILDPGAYYFAVGNGAHEALNSIMLVQGMDETLMVGTGDTTAVHTENITEDFISKTAFSISKTGHQISNQIPYSDWNYYQPGEVEYLSRADWEATWPKQYHNMTVTSTELLDHLNGKYYVDDNCPDTIYFDEYRKRFNELRESGADVLITEGLLTLWDEETRDKINMKIFVDCRSDERHIRRINRNVKYGQKYEDITDVFINMVRFRHDQYVEPSKWTADLIVNGSQNTDMVLEMVVEKVKRSLKA